MVRESSLFPPQFQLLLFSGFTQQCHFGAFGIGSCFKSALITRRCVNRQQAQSAKMTIRIIVPGFISTDLLSLHTRQRLVQQIFELDQLLLRKIDTSLHCLRNNASPFSVSERKSLRSLFSSLIRLIYPCLSSRFESGARVVFFAFRYV